MEMKSFGRQPSLSSLEDQLPEDLRGTVLALPSAPLRNRAGLVEITDVGNNESDGIGATAALGNELDEEVMRNLVSQTRVEKYYTGSGKYYLVPVFWALTMIPVVVAALMGMLSAKYCSVDKPCYCKGENAAVRHITSGTCTSNSYKFIDEISECQDAAMTLGGINRTATTESSSIDPYGCYLKREEDTLWLNSDSNLLAQITVIPFIDCTLMFVLVAFSLHFLYFLAKDGYVLRTLQSFMRSSVSQRRASLILNRANWFFFFLKFASMSLFNIMLKVNNIELYLIYFLSGLIFFESIYKVTELWVFSCWLINSRGDEIAASVSYSSLVDGSFMETYVDLYKSMTEISQVWKYIHVTRVIIGVPLLWLYLQGAATKSIPLLERRGNGSLGVLIYFTIWISVAIAGFSNDYVHSKCSCQVSAIPYETETETKLDNVANNLRRIEFERIRADAIIRLDAIKLTQGISFLGVKVTSANAISVGTLLFAVVNASINTDA